MISEGELIEIEARRKILDEAIENADLVILSANPSDCCPPDYDKLQDLRNDLESAGDRCREDMRRMIEEIRKLGTGK